MVVDGIPAFQSLGEERNYTLSGKSLVAGNNGNRRGL